MRSTCRSADPKKCWNGSIITARLCYLGRNAVNFQCHSVELIVKWIYDRGYRNAKASV
jgi:hypothetical protein